MYQVFLPIIIVAQVALSVFGAQDACWGCYRNYYAPGSSVEISFNWSEYRSGRLSLSPIEDIIYMNHYVILRIEQTPDEYKMFPGNISSAPTDIGLQQLIVDTREVISYTHVQAVSYFNEPNVEDSDFAFIGGYGKHYEDGVLYARQLCEFYDGIKSEYPEVSVVAGELTNNRSDFVIAFVSNSVGCWDYVAIHSYSEYLMLDWEEIPEYIDWLHNIAGLPQDAKIIVSEMGLQYSGDCNTPGFIVEQENYYKYVIGNLETWGAVAAFAYTVGGNGWLCTDVSSAGFDSPSYYFYYISTWLIW